MLTRAGKPAVEQIEQQNSRAAADTNCTNWKLAAVKQQGERGWETTRLQEQGRYLNELTGDNWQAGVWTTERVVNMCKANPTKWSRGFYSRNYQDVNSHSKQNLGCEAAATHSRFSGTCYGCLEDTFIVTTQEKQLPKVSLWKRLLELTVKLWSCCCLNISAN